MEYRLLAALLVLAASGRAANPPVVSASSAAAGSAALEELVDPLVGAIGRGGCVPGPCWPHASIYPSPNTAQSMPGAYRGNRDIIGFAQLHAQCLGGPSYANFLIVPWRGLALQDSEHTSPKANEEAKPYRYSVQLTKPDVRAEIVPARHAALYRFTFPTADDSHLMIDVARKIGGIPALDQGSVRVDAARGVIVGGGRFSLNWNPAPYELFFAARVSETPSAFGTWVGSSVQPGIARAETTAMAAPSGDPKQTHRESMGAYFRFKTSADRPVCLKIAISFLSVEQAQRWLDTEIPGWDFAALEKAAAAEWRRQLSVVSLERADAEEQRKIYTMLWRALIMPRDRTGDMPGFDPRQPLWDDQFTLWDMWKTLYPLLAIIQPETVRDNIKSFVHRHRVSGGLVTAAFTQGKEYKVGQGGNEADNVIADAFVKHIPGVDWAEVYRLLQYQAEYGRSANYRDKGWAASDEKTDYSWRFRSGSGTLGFAYNDFCVAQVARGLGHAADADFYLARSRNWRNVWDDRLEDEGFRGFVHSRNLDGTFVDPDARPSRNKQGRQGYNRDFYEATWWIGSVDVPHDLPGVAEKMGGHEALLRRLIYAFGKDYINAGNEPGFMMPWWFAQLGRPYLTSFWADRVRRDYQGVNYPSDDDSGALSSRYIFLDAGFYPIAGQDIYYLHGPCVPKLTFHLANGKTFTVEGENAGAKNIYVQSATLNGRPLDTAAIHHADIVAGGTLRFVMGPQPSPWGTHGDFDAARAARELALAAP